LGAVRQYDGTASPQIIGQDKSILQCSSFCVLLFEIANVLVQLFPVALAWEVTTLIFPKELPFNAASKVHQVVHFVPGVRPCLRAVDSPGSCRRSLLGAPERRREPRSWSFVPVAVP